MHTVGHNLHHSNIAGMSLHVTVLVNFSYRQKLKWTLEHVYDIAAAFLSVDSGLHAMLQRR